MKSMAGGSYLVAIRRTFFSEFVSMNMVMVGMIPVMVILMSRLPGGNDPKRPLFWGIMSLATMAGALTAYPINSWMVRLGIKHGMMTAQRGPASAPPGHAMPQGQAMSHGHHGAHLPLGRVAGVSILTLVCLGAAVWVTSRFAELRF